MVTIIIIAAVVLFIAAPAAWKLRARIFSNKLATAGTSPSERNQQRLNDLIGKLPAQRAAVARVMSVVDATERKLTAARAEADAKMEEYETAKNSGASAEAVDAISTDWQTADTTADNLEKALAEAHTQADEAQKVLANTVKAMQAQQHLINDQKTNEELAAAYTVANEAKTALDSTQSGLGSMAADRAKSQEMLDNARNQGKLNQGSKVDLERAEIAEKAQATRAKSALEAALAVKRGGTANANASAPASTTTSNEKK